MKFTLTLTMQFTPISHMTYARCAAVSFLFSGWQKPDLTLTGVIVYEPANGAPTIQFPPGLTDEGLVKVVGGRDCLVALIREAYDDYRQSRSTGAFTAP